VGGFSGIFNGNSHTIRFTMNRNDSVGLFNLIDGAKIYNLLVNATVSGKGSCGVVAVTSTAGSSFISSGVYSDLTCAKADGGALTSVGGFVARLINPQGSSEPVSFNYSVSQSRITLVASSPDNIYQAGFYGTSVNTKTTLGFSYSLCLFNTYGNGFRIRYFGFNLENSSKRSNPASELVASIPKPVVQRVTTAPTSIPADCNPDCSTYDYSLCPSDPNSQSYFNYCTSFYRSCYQEDPCCCTGFNSCPYVQCSAYANKICPNCRYGKKKEEEYTFENFPLMIPTTYQLD